VAARVVGDTSGHGGAGEGDIVFFALPADPPPVAVRASPPLALAAMGASATVRLVFDDLHVAADDVIATVPFAAWRERDRVATALPHPAPFGVAATAVRLLSGRARATGEQAVAGAASGLAAELDECRTHAYRLSDEGGTGPDDLAALVEARAWGLDVALRSAHAVVAATGGEAMALSHPGQRLLREAAFYAIQAQTSALRDATLARLARRQASSS
jgi:alkylation response protein AidB-like acyl-CoA dehydrogenase